MNEWFCKTFYPHGHFIPYGHYPNEDLTRMDERRTRRILLASHLVLFVMRRANSPGSSEKWALHSYLRYCSVFLCLAMSNEGPCGMWTMNALGRTSNSKLKQKIHSSLRKSLTFKLTILQWQCDCMSNSNNSWVSCDVIDSSRSQFIQFTHSIFLSAR